MSGVIKIWRQAAIKAERCLSTRDASKYKLEQARIDRAIMMLRKGAISTTRKALESKGLGDLQDHDIII